MKIHQAPMPKGWTSIPNATIEDGTLSIKARGLLAYLLSRPEGWDFSALRMARSPHALVDGRESILAAMKELSTGGYLRSERVQDPVTGHWSNEGTVYAEPQIHARQTPLEGA